MEFPTDRKQASHLRIVSAAARALRRSGCHGVGVADVMKKAGLTHGGFYAHFASRDALLAEAVAAAGRDNDAAALRCQAARRQLGASALRAVVDGYLSATHLASAEAGAGCVVAAVASEMPRQAPEVREAAALRVHALIERVRAALPAHLPRAQAASQAASIASTLVGALQLARALGSGREAQAILKAARSELLGRYDAT